MKNKSNIRKTKKIEVKAPSLFRRGKKQIFYLRLRTKFKDIWVSTKTADKKEAEKRSDQIIKAKFKVEALRATEDLKENRDRKIIDAVVKTVSGKDEIPNIRIDECYQRWCNVNSSYSELTEKSKSIYQAAFGKFTSWCAGKNIEHIEHVDRSLAMSYSKHLWDIGISGKTYNDHLKLLSRVFATIDATTPLPYRDPFNRIHIPRKKKSESGAEGHGALEPDMLKNVIAEAAKNSLDYRDLIIIGSQTGLRLKDAVLLKWDCITLNFIDVIPFKTSRTSNKARIPITATLRKVLESRMVAKGKNKYVIPSVAEHYMRNEHYVTKTCKTIFENALNKEGEDITRKDKAGAHRKRRSSLYSFHSLRTTYMSLLATKDVSIRDAMRILGWESSEMIKVYEKMLEAYRGDADKRALDIVSQIKEFKLPVPDVIPGSKITPSKEKLEKLVGKYSNIAIARIFNVSEAAVRKWMDKFGIKRARRIESADVSGAEIEKIRKDLLAMQEKQK